MRNSRPKSSRVVLDYAGRVNRAIDFILQHLDEPLRLEVVARAAGFSPFHFHRIFRLMAGESVSEFVKRVRLERAVGLLSRRGWGKRRRSLTEIALACGFGSSADFSRCFRQQFGVAPSGFDAADYRDRGRAKWDEARGDSASRPRLTSPKPGANPDGFVVRVRRLPPRCVAYVRVLKSAAGGGVAGAVARLTQWAEARGLADGQWLGYMWDDPEVVPWAKCRYDVGLEVPALKPEGAIGRIAFPAMQVAELKVSGGIDLELRALDWLFGTWLPASGWLPTDQPCFEAWDGRPFAHGTEHFELRLQVPVERD
ncbi:MAG TPA: AraC family transcriptional regulator [Lacunisphaera sp.]|nr:AraC family transcriptional regulator [Lacunisphaera sp.]